MLYENFYNIRNNKAIVVKVIPENNKNEDIFSEICSLLKVLNTEIIGYVSQRRDIPDNKYFIGEGKVSEVKKEIEVTNADIIVFDNNLKPSHVYNLEKVLNKKILDRSEVILEIFRNHAQTRESQLEIELARLKYIYPRLKRMWGHIHQEQISGRMMAGRGPGEKQLESDRRLVKQRIEKINKEIIEITQHKERIIESRSKLTTCALLGYTNAGKTTIFNAFTNLRQNTSTELFTTLDTKVSLIKLPNKLELYLIDTVGFIKDMPEHLLRAFHTTLKEAIHSDILLLVFDVSRKNFGSQITSVEKTLDDLNVSAKERIYIFNKIDKVEDELELITLNKKYEDKNPIFISAKTQDGINKIMKKLQVITDTTLKIYEINIDITKGKLINFIHNYAQILNEQINTKTISYRIKTHPSILQKILNDYNIEVELIGSDQ